MIRGEVRGREARIRLVVHGAGRRRHELTAIIDTGYTASLTLPPDLIADLALPWHSVGRGILADGSECLFDVYEATIVWDNKRRRILVDEADAVPLLGMGLLQGYKLTLEARARGKVRITKLPRR